MTNRAISGIFPCLVTKWYVIMVSDGYHPESYTDERTLGYMGTSQKSRLSGNEGKKRFYTSYFITLSHFTSKIAPFLWNLSRTFKHVGLLCTDEPIHTDGACFLRPHWVMELRGPLFKLFFSKSAFLRNQNQNSQFANPHSSQLAPSFRTPFLRSSCIAHTCAWN